MTIKSVGMSAMLLAVLAAARLLAQAPPAAPKLAKDEIDARGQLGERFCDLGLSFAAATRLSKSSLQESAALIEAATLMDPKEPRFLRLLARVREQQGDVDGAVDAWAKYRIQVPEDEIAQIAMIDLFISQMQANDVKVAYLRDTILANPNIVARVKAHAAFRAAEQLSERSTSEARDMLARARGYYPLPEVMEGELNLLPAKATPAERMKALLGALRANPMRPDLIARVADMLAGAGYSEESLNWYASMLDVHRGEKTAPQLTSLINYLTERYRAGDATVVSEQLDNQILKGFPEDKDAWFLRLTIARSNESAIMLKQAQQVFLKRLDAVAAAIANGTPLPSTQPAPSSASAPAATQPDIELTPLLANAVQRAKQSPDARSRDVLAIELVDLAWFELYFDHNAPAADPILKVLKELLPAENVSLRNLIGWYDFVSGDENGARELFTAQQDVEPLSALGLFRLEEQKNKNVEAAVIGVKIASHPRAGWLGAILWEAIKGRGFKPDAKTDEIAAIKTELATFPRDWLHVAQDAGRFYTIRAEPIKIDHRLGEPMLAVVTLENNCELDLTIGDFGLIKPTLVFDAQLKGANEKSFPAIVIDRLMGRQVLAKNESISQVVRIDQGELSAALRERPANQLLLTAHVVTNMVLVGPSFFQPRAGGCVRRFNNGFTRTLVSLASNVDRRQFFEKMAVDAPADKLLDIELLAAYINLYVHSNASPQEQELSQQYAIAIDKYRADPAPSVKIWASYMYANLLNGAQEQRAIGDMLQSQSWELRMLALVAARRNLPPEITRQIAIRQANTDSNPLVKSYAGAIVESLQTPATQPATIPPGGK